MKLQTTVKRLSYGGFSVLLLLALGVTTNSFGRINDVTRQRTYIHPRSYLTQRAGSAQQEPARYGNLEPHYYYPAPVSRPYPYYLYNGYYDDYEYRRTAPYRGYYTNDEYPWRGYLYRAQ